MPPHGQLWPTQAATEQSCGRPCLHETHFPQNANGITATRSPGLTRLTELPTASTSAENS